MRQDFALKTPLEDPKDLDTIAAMKQSNSVSVHVRRSDYIGSYFAGIATPAYYEKALEHIKSKVSDPAFFIFSDDIAWCKEHLPVGNEAHFIDRNTGKNSYKDLILMSNCKHNIIANSSFSRRGAWLNDNSDKIVIAPQKRHQNLDYKDIVPAERIRV
ncbi:alpha-1,2-fucosyltransferase [Patescibacteria group bacterium]|nr:alpha-1,2-fucosyltransferase [Patescibacteria group bacterium]